LFIFELKCGEMENRIVTKSLRKQLYQVILHEQMENGNSINNNFNANHVLMKLVKHKGAPSICNKIPREKNVILKMYTHRLSLDEGVRNLNLDKELCWNQ
jgi:hypothetical protein